MIFFFIAQSESGYPSEGWESLLNARASSELRPLIYAKSVPQEAEFVHFLSFQRILGKG